MNRNLKASILGDNAIERAIMPHPFIRQEQAHTPVARSLTALRTRTSVCSAKGYWEITSTKVDEEPSSANANPIQLTVLTPRYSGSWSEHSTHMTAKAQSGHASNTELKPASIQTSTGIRLVRHTAIQGAHRCVRSSSWARQLHIPR